MQAFIQITEQVRINLTKILKITWKIETPDKKIILYTEPLGFQIGEGEKEFEIFSKEKTKVKIRHLHKQNPNKIIFSFESNEIRDTNLTLIENINEK